MIKVAYQIGVKVALEEAGLVKEAFTPAERALVGAIVGGLGGGVGAELGVHAGAAGEIDNHLHIDKYLQAR